MNEYDKDLVNDQILPDVQKWLMKPNTNKQHRGNPEIGLYKTCRNTRQFKRLKTVRCCCGAVLLVVSDVEAMTHVINVHAAKHWNNQAVAKDLVGKVLKAASEASLNAK